MNDLVIRQATVRDVDAIARNNIALARESEDKQLDPATVQCGARALLDDSSKGFYLVAERAGAVVGQLMITVEWSDWRNATFWWIQSVYVVPKARRQGVFRALYDHAVALAQSGKSVCGIRLYVESNNAAARRAYETLGMHRAAYDIYEAGF
ncbi:MAG TPA: GNAT family N-acetyltransferase [Verrucomicrobiae bacterium]|nr:GNAT family N-acetyltransferase [Verrucomicrobiae bacterium]